jgi:hypothetical protein
MKEKPPLALFIYILILYNKIIVLHGIIESLKSYNNLW